MNGKEKQKLLNAAFTLFDSDDDSSDEERTNFQVPLPPVVVPVAPQPAPAQSNFAQENSTSSIAEIWPHRLPKVLGPVRYQYGLTDIGGHRGFVAASDIRAGTLLLLEEAIVPPPIAQEEPDEDSDAESNDNHVVELIARQILRSRICQEVIADMEQLHPVWDATQNTSPHFEPKDWECYASLITKLQVEFESMHLSKEKVLQILCAIQFNFFAGGLFLHAAIFNHSCAPNCVKFVSSVAENMTEIRAAKDIAKGTPLTISYADPLEQSRGTRRKLLAELGFKCECQLCEGPEEEDPGSEKLEDIEKHVSIAESMLREHDYQGALSLALDCLSDTLEVLSHDKRIFMRLHRLVGNCCEKLVNFGRKGYLEHAILFLRSCMELRDLQLKFLAADHMDCARTCQDISQGIQLLLTFDPNALYEEFPEELANFQTASHAENRYRKEFLRVKKLYE